LLKSIFRSPLTVKGLGRSPKSILAKNLSKILKKAINQRLLNDKRELTIMASAVRDDNFDLLVIKQFVKRKVVDSSALEKVKELATNFIEAIYSDFKVVEDSLLNERVTLTVSDERIATILTTLSSECEVDGKSRLILERLLKENVPVVFTKEVYDEMKGTDVLKVLYLRQVILGVIPRLEDHLVDKVIPVKVPDGFPKFIQPPEELACFDYALMQAGEKEGFFTEFMEFELPGLLQKLNYTFELEPSVGDLVLFCKDSVPTHMGIVREGGLIESKWGNNKPVAYLHSIENSPKEYGDQVIYCRKKDNL